MRRWRGFWDELTCSWGEIKTVKQFVLGIVELIGPATHAAVANGLGLSVTVSQVAIWCSDLKLEARF